METILNYCNQMLLLTGLLFSVTGIITYVFPPKKINSLYGYRTGSSMKNQQRWDFAQAYSAKLMLLLGVFLMIVSFIKGLLKTTDETHIILVITLPIIGLIVLIVRVEKVLRKI